MSLSKEKMIKAIEVIKMRKNIKHLIDKYFFSKSLLAEALEVCPKVISDLLVLLACSDLELSSLYDSDFFILEDITPAITIIVSTMLQI